LALGPFGIGALTWKGPGFVGWQRSSSIWNQPTMKQSRRRAKRL
jgi:hypothetical protein